MMNFVTCSATLHFQCIFVIFNKLLLGSKITARFFWFVAYSFVQSVFKWEEEQRTMDFKNKTRANIWGWSDGKLLRITDHNFDHLLLLQRYVIHKIFRSDQSQIFELVVLFKVHAFSDLHTVWAKEYATNKQIMLYFWNRVIWPLIRPLEWYSIVRMVSLLTTSVLNVCIPSSISINYSSRWIKRNVTCFTPNLICWRREFSTQFFTYLIGSWRLSTSTDLH